MQKRPFNTPVGRALFVFIGLAILSAFKPDGIIVLQDEPLPFKPAGYYIAEVTDNRAVKNAIAQLVINPTTTQPADLQGGAAAAISRFIANNLPKDHTPRAVNITLKDLKLTETPLPNNRVDGVINLHLSFGLQKNYGTEHLVDYKGGLHYIRSANNTTATEQHLRGALKNSLVYFNNWMKANVNDNLKLAKTVKISFEDHAEATEGDTIYYSPRRPITWADFQSKTGPGGPYAAAVIPGISYDESHKVVDGTIHVSVAINAYLPKSACWASHAARDSYSLNHEQRHFDIAKIIAEQYKQKLLAEKLTPDTYEAFIGMQYLDSYRDMHKMQTAYDNETRHGRDTFAQSEWNERIDKELKLKPAL